MGAWISQHWFDFLQSVGIVASLLFTAFSILRDETTRRNANLLVIAARHHDIWKQLHERPGLSRVIDAKATLDTKPLSDEEQIFITELVLHLDTVYRTTKSRMFVPVEGLRKDVKDFFSLPLPRAAWKKLKPYQDADFVRFVEDTLAPRGGESRNRSF